MQTRNLTILLTDMKGFTRRTSGQSRSATLDMIREHKTLLVPVIEARGGKLIKTIGDAFLVTFDSPTDAVLTGIALQNTLREHNAHLPVNDRVEIRVAINTGEVALEEGDVYGEPVNIAARIEGIAEANEIYFTEATYLAMNKAEVPSAEIGYRVLKGIPQKIKVYRVLREGESPPPAQPDVVFEPVSGVPSFRPAPLWRRAAAFAIDAALVFLAVFLLTAGQRSKINHRMAEIHGQMKSEEIHSSHTTPHGRPENLRQAVQNIKGRRDKLKKTSQGIWHLIFVFYTAVLLGLKGKTIGKHVMKLRVVRSDGEPLGFKRASIRTILYYLSAIPFFIGFIWVLWDPRRLTWHDKISDTVVLPVR